MLKFSQGLPIPISPQHWHRIPLEGSGGGGGGLTSPTAGRRGSTKARAHLGNLVELAEELIQHHYQLFGRAVAGQLREAHNISVENAGGGVRPQDGSEPVTGTIQSSQAPTTLTLIIPATPQPL